jgi:PAS domain S-box-containing protein
MFTIQETIRESMHQLFDAVAAISVQGYDEKLKVTYWNTGSELLYGYTAAEALSRTLQDLIIPQQMQKEVITAHKNWLDHGIEIPAAELILKNKNGQNLSVFSSHIMYYSKQHGHEMYCIDISLADIKRAQAQVALKDNLLKSVFEATPDLFFLLEENGTIIDYHAGENKNLYSHPIHYIGRSIAEILPEKVVASVQAYSKKAMHQGGLVSF